MTRGEGQRKGATLVVGILPEPELQDWHGYSEWAERQPGRGLALKRYHLRDFPQPLRRHRQRYRPERAQTAGTASKHQKRFVGDARNAEGYSQISGLCPRGCAVCLRGAPVSVPQSNLEILCFASVTLFHQGEDEMRRSTLSIMGLAAMLCLGLAAPSAMAIDGLLANATVSFGEWNPNATNLIPTNPGEVPLDRLVGDPGGGRGNTHELIPKITTIKEGGSVNFIISGGHIVAVYDDGTRPEDIGTAIEPDCAFPLPPSGITSPCSPVNAPPPAGDGLPIAGGILSDSDNRIYRGAFLNLVRRDGVEVVQFTKPGTYLVICARKNHFINSTTGEFQMFGFVKVLPGK
jgi:hypothetical protein